MDIKTLMMQAQNMQQKMQAVQEASANKQFEGKSGGGLVSMILTGNGKMHQVNIDPSLLQTKEKDILEDLIIAAYNDAKIKVDQESRQNISGAFGGISGLPSDFNF